MGVKSAQVPLWAWCIEKAEAFGQTPWDIYGDTSLYWFSRINEFNRVKAEVTERNRKKNQRGNSRQWRKR